ncbi:MAG: isoprenyl transferase [Verrucomicrobiota bacterium]
MPNEASSSSIPKHIAVIMDGNGRWAKERGLPRSEGHRAGAESVREVVESCNVLGVEFLTLYAFSSENWSRPKHEIDALMKLLERFLKEKGKELQQQNIRLQAIGRLDDLPDYCQKALDDAIDATSENSGLTLILALSYGGREEIIDGIKSLYRQIEDGKLEIGMLDPDLFSKHLYTRYYPDPDLMIRTSGEMRLSNFLLWQLSYAEIVITKKYWPDFRKDDLQAALDEFAKRQRRFGGV